MSLLDNIKHIADKALKRTIEQSKHSQAEQCPTVAQAYADAIADDRWRDYLKDFCLNEDEFKVFRQVQRLLNDDCDYEAAIRIADEWSERGSEDLCKALCPYCADAYLKAAQHDVVRCKALAQEAIQRFQKVLQIMPNNKWAQLNISNAYILNDQFLTARDYLLPLFKSNLEERAKNLYRQNIDKLKTAKLMDVPFAERKNVLVVNDEDILAEFYRERIPGFNYCFSTFDKPLDVKFFPEMSGAFIAHPKLTDNYIDMKRYELSVLEMKIADMKKFLLAAGASYYRISCRQKENYDMLRRLGFRIGADSSLHQNDLKSGEDKSVLQSSEEICFIEERLSPEYVPCLDPDLVWKDEWLSIWKERENGLLTLHYALNLTDFEKVLPKEREAIKAYFDAKDIKISGDILCYYFADHDSSNNVELDVVAYFKPLSEFMDNGLSLSEKAYKDDVMTCLKDGGDIDDKERLFLDLRRKTLNIANEKAVEIETVCLQAQFTPNERDYMQLYKGMLALGIDDKALTLLNKCISDLGISADRRKLIERVVNSR